MSVHGSSLRLLLGGDVMLGRLVADELGDKGVDYAFAALQPVIRSADLFLVNLECALTARRSVFEGAPKAFYFRAPPEAAKVLRAAGVALACLANNHVLDAGPRGLDDTIRCLARDGIASVGAGRNLEEAAAVRVLDRGEIRIGVLAACDHQRDFAATPSRPGIHFLDLREVRVRHELVQRVRSEAARVDHLIVALHWMPNWVSAIPADYLNLARDLVGAGARVVWGHSPHHILGSQLWSSGVALYSTGDLIDDYALHAEYRNDRQLLYCVQVGPARVRRVTAFPIVLRVGRAEPADAGARAWIGARLASACGGLGTSVVPLRAGHALRLRPAGAAHAAGR